MSIMPFNDLVIEARKYFPDLKISYKDQSIFMRIIGTLMFFNKAFMNNYITTIGNTIYFPSKEFVNDNEVGNSLILLHELIHISDSKKYGSLLFKLGYLFPQILILLCLPLFLLSWKIALPLTILFCLPLPAYFRMNFERRAYFVSLYASYKYNKFIDLKKEKSNYLSQFKNSSYYFMWVFSLEKDFDEALVKITNNKHPFDDDIFLIIDSLIDKM